MIQQSVDSAASAALTAVANPPEERSDQIAIVGMAGRFPGASTVDAFWRNLCAGVEAITHFSDEQLRAAGVSETLLRRPEYVKARAILPAIDEFDAHFFGFTPREAQLLDPQQRIFLEVAWEALERAGYDPARCDGTIGVFAGASLNSYLLHLYSQPELLELVGEYQAALSNDKDHLATRVAYKLNLRGPCVSVQTACSTSLVATHLACQSLLDGECDLALAGGVSIRMPQVAGYLAHEGSIFSPDGHCRAFDAAAAGTVEGSGVGIVVLKRLPDALRDGDQIHAVICGSAINNDGALKANYTAPSEDGQAAVIAEAQAIAGVDPATIGYVEAHGTGTPLGDPIEIAALTSVFRSSVEQTGFCALGSVKPNIGHLDAAAGVAGLIKAALTLQHRQIPPTLHFQTPNPRIAWQDNPFYVNAQLRSWPDGPTPRRAAVSSFGIGGTNAHLILEEAPHTRSDPAGSPQLLVLSARSAAALERQADQLLAHLSAHPDLNLADVAYTLQVGRAAFSHRRIVVAADLPDAIRALEERDATRSPSGLAEQRQPPVALLLPGQGAQHPSMGRALYETEPIFRAEIERCAALFAPHLQLDLREVLYPAADRAAWAAELLGQTQITQPALFAVEYALAQLWVSWGIEPGALLGHSIGEYVAATLAEVWSLADGVALVAARGRLMGELPPGAMLAVALPEAEILPLLDDQLALAAINGPAQCVVAGPTAAVAALHTTLALRGVECRPLPATHAFHSPIVEPIIAPFERLVAGVTLAPPRIPILSNVTGTWLTADQATDPGYWATQLRAPVRFAAALAELLDGNRAAPAQIVLETGPGQTLSSLARRHPARRPTQRVLASLPHPDASEDDRTVLLQTLGRLWLAGVAIDWAARASHQLRRRVALPTYPFERQRYWIERRPLVGSAAPTIEAEPRATPLEPPPASAAPQPRPALEHSYTAPRTATEREIAAIWAELFGLEQIGIHDNFFELGGNSLSGIQLIARLRSAFDVELPMSRLFETPTVAALAAIIADGERPAPPDDDLDQLLREIEGLSQEQVAAQLTAASDGGATTASAPAPAAAPAMRLQELERESAAATETEQALHFSLFFFSDDGSSAAADKYRLLIEAARFADEHGFAAVWTPERHFQNFGGLYPNPSVLGAALAMTTRRLQIRAGSVALPLHHPVRVAEEWAVVDNLSGGRVGVSMASGWNPRDFVLSATPYEERRAAMWEQIQLIQRLWAGERVAVPGVRGGAETVTILPRPIQPQLPIWITTTGTIETWQRAGAIGANVLATLINQPFEELARRITLYRATLAAHGHDPRAAQVTVMLHTFVGPDNARIKEQVRAPLRHYLQTFVDQFRHVIVQDVGVDVAELAAGDQAAVLDYAFERYFETSSLLGAPAKCARLIDRLRAIGVDEIACLVDFGLDAETVLAGLEPLDRLRAQYCSEGRP